ncbi:MAG: hypothetical protein E4H24_04450 [Thermomicrobiales bacterium]|nr:MAG: hypothetical protein E4H24_04450 [Thermomicrobiales bacterium]
MAGETFQELIDRALDAYAELAELGETVEDEWSYVNDLADAWRARFDHVVEHRGHAPAPDEASEATDRAIDEIGRIEDPHRAIDWLSTFPQVVLIAMGERP